MASPGYGTIPSQGAGRKRQTLSLFSGAVAALALLLLGVAAVMTVHRIASTTELIDKKLVGASNGWMSVVEHILSNTKPKTKSALAAQDAPAPAPAPASAPAPAKNPNKLGSLGVGVDHWPWDKADPNVEKVRKSKEHVLRDLLHDFPDVKYPNPLFQRKALKHHRTSSLESYLVGKGDEELPPRTGRQRTDICSDDTPNCNALRQKTAVNVYSWPWDAESNGKWEYHGAVPTKKEAASADQAAAAAAIRPTLLRAVSGLKTLQKDLDTDAGRIIGLSQKGVAASDEEAVAQAIQMDSFLMARAAASQSKLANTLSLTLPHLVSLSDTGNSTSAGNSTNATAKDGFELIPRWKWLENKMTKIEQNGVNVDSWPGGMFSGAIKWQRKTSQQLKEDASDMSWMANNDASKLPENAMDARKRAAWEASLAQQLAKDAQKIKNMQMLDDYDGCSCGGSTDEDKGPRCECYGQPQPHDPDTDMSSSEVTSW